MLRRLSKIILLVMFIGVLIFSLTACDRFRGSRGFNVEVVIDGVETAEHYEAFRVINSYDETQLEWDEADFDDGSFRAELAGFIGEVEFELIINDNEIDGEYRIVEPEGGIFKVDKDNNIATFEVGLDYDAELVGLKIDGPEKIFASQRQGEKAKYEFTAELYDQYDNKYDGEVEWSIKDKPAGVTLDDNIISVAWDIKPGEFIIEANAIDNKEIKDSFSVELNYLDDDLESEYEKVFNILEEKLDSLGLEEVEGDLKLPEEIELEGNKYEVIWSSNHSAIEIINNQPVVAEVNEVVEGYIEAFIQPADKAKQTNAGSDDKRKRKYKVVVVNPIEVEFNLSLKHSFPQSKIDDTAILSMDREKLFITADNIEICSKSFYEQKTFEEINELIIRFKENLSYEDINKILSDFDYELIDEVKSKNLILVEFYDSKIYDVIEKLRNRDEIEYIERNEKAFALATNIPDDELYPYQWHYPQIRLPQAWSITTGSSDIRIAVLDTGIDAEHPDLQGQVDTDNGYDFVNLNDDATDINWHGTHVAGTIGARTNNNYGVAGVMWDVELLPVKVLEGNSGSYWGIAAGIYYAAGLHENLPESFYNSNNLPKNPKPVDIINMSLGGSSDSEILRDAVQAVYNEGVLMVAAAGNFGRTTLLYPAKYPEVISVGATDFNYPYQPNVVNYSHSSNLLDIVAPGGNTDVDTNNNSYRDGVLSTTTGTESYSRAQGTSMAAPHVSGVIGLMLSEGINPDEIRDILQRTAMNLGEYNFSNQYGYGLINAYWAVNQVEHIDINLYKNNGEGFSKIDRQILTLGKDSIVFDVPGTGRYKVEAIVDVQGTSSVNPGDYYGVVYLDVERENSEVTNIELEEIGW